MQGYPLDLLIGALGMDRSCYVLGAGASAPDVPPMGQLPDRIASYAPRLGSFAPSLPDSPIRRLLGPVIAEALTTSSLDKWKAGAMTPASIAYVLQDLITAAHWVPLPQYAVFHLFSPTSTIVSFNWDGLAWARCPQRVICPHGTVRPRLYTAVELDELLDNSQYYDSDDAREWIIPRLVMPGEEEGKKLAAMRERVLEVWLSASQAVVIGYSFGIRSALSYDRVWLDSFIEAFRANDSAAVHLVAPDAEFLRGEIAERLKRSVNVHAWPLNWHTFSVALLRVAAINKCSNTLELRRHAEDVRVLYQSLAHGPIAAA
jgi:hypothetical protein